MGCCYRAGIHCRCDRRGQNGGGIIGYRLNTVGLGRRGQIAWAYDTTLIG